MKEEGRFEDLEAGLKDLARETAEAGPSAAVEETLRRAVRARKKSRIPIWLWGVAAALLAGVFAGWLLRGPSDRGLAQLPAEAANPSATPLAPEAPGDATEPRAVAIAARPATARASQRDLAPREPVPLSPWFFNSGLPRPARGRAILVDVSEATAARFGVGVTGPVRAEVLIGDDGLTRAIRFVR